LTFAGVASAALDYWVLPSRFCVHPGIARFVKYIFIHGDWPYRGVARTFFRDVPSVLLFHPGEGETRFLDERTATRIILCQCQAQTTNPAGGSGIRRIGLMLPVLETAAGLVSVDADSCLLAFRPVRELVPGCAKSLPPIFQGWPHEPLFLVQENQYLLDVLFFFQTHSRTDP
jgi:hypothetical protein